MVWNSLAQTDNRWENWYAWVRVPWLQGVVFKHSAMVTAIQHCYTLFVGHLNILVTHSCQKYSVRDSSTYSWHCWKWVVGCNIGMAHWYCSVCGRFTSLISAASGVH